jgi:hypothetical protein
MQVAPRSANTMQDPRPSFMGPRPPDFISAEDIQGCWCCVTGPLSAIEAKRAVGPDVLWHTGCCFPLFLPYSEAWDRDGDTNTFVKRPAGRNPGGDRLPYSSAGGPLCLGPTLSCRLGICCVKAAEPVQLVECPELAGEWRPVDNGRWTRPHQANHSYTVERWDALGRNAYVTGGESSPMSPIALADPCKR